MIIEYIRRVVVPHMRKYNLKKLFLLIGCAKCHEKQTVRDYCGGTGSRGGRGGKEKRKGLRKK